MDNPEIAKNFVGNGDLSEDEHIRLHFFLTALMRVREFSWLQYMNGQIDEAQWTTELVVIRNVLGTDRTRHWWLTMGRRTFGTEFSNFVDASIKDQPKTDDFWLTLQNWSVR